MQSSNPVLTRLGEAAQDERGAIAGGSARSGYDPTAHSAPPGYGDPAYSPVIVPGRAAVDRPMTIDDVVVRTVMLVLLTGVAAAASWIFLRGGSWLGIATVGASLTGLVLALVISFRRITNPLAISAYAILQGLLLGVVSRVFEQFYPGIVVQAVGATFGIFLGMAALYRFRVIRATPRFTRWVIGALFGVVALSLINFLLSLFGHNLGYEYYGPTGHAGTIAIIFSLLCIGVGALTFILDFDQVEQGVRYGLPERYAWYCGFGILVGLIYLYWQILRMLGYLRR